MNWMVWLLVGTVQLTLDQAVERALEVHDLLKSAQQQTLAAQYDTKSARAAFFPQLSVSAQASHSTYTQSFTQLVPVAVDPQTFRLIYRSVDVQFSYPNTYRIQATASQVIFDFGKTLYAYWVKRKGETLAELDQKKIRKQVELQTKTLYLSALLARQSLDVLKRLESNLRAHYRSVERQYHAGLASELDMLRSEVAWRNVIPQVKQAETATAQAMDLLRAYLQVEDRLELVDSLVLPDSGLLAQLKQKPWKVEERLDLQALELQKAQLGDLAKLQRSLYLPTLVAFASYNLNRPLGFEDRWGNFTVYGVQLQWSLFDGGRALAAARAAAARRNALGFLSHFQQTLARVELRSALRKLDQAVSQLASNRRAVEVSRRTLKLARQQVKSGLISELDFQDIQLADARARLNWYRAVYDVQKALLDLEAARWGIQMETKETGGAPSGSTESPVGSTGSGQAAPGVGATGPGMEGGRP